MTLLARNDDYRWRYGTFTSSGITSTYSIPNWAAQADQIQDNQTVIPWLAPNQPIPPEFTRVVLAADGSAQNDGFIQGVLGPFDYWTFGMMAYVASTNFPSSVFSAPGSLLVYDKEDVAMYLNATMYLPIHTNEFQDFEPAVGGYKNVRVRYGIGTVTS